MSFDPANDTPARMTAYSAFAAQHPTAAPWHFVTTRSPAELQPILAAYGQAVDKKQNAADPTGPLNHTLRVFLVDRKDPIVLPQNSPELFALTRLRDEAHRFAITFQRKVSRKRGLQSQLDSVPGVGETRRKALLIHFGSLKRLKEATIEDISRVESIGPAVAERIHAFLHQPLDAQLEDDAEDEVRAASIEDANGPETKA